MTEKIRASWFSNEWLVPVRERTRSILSPFPTDEAIIIAASILVEEDAYVPNIPWTVVQTSQGIDVACSKLLTVAKTPDKQTPDQNPKFHSAINDLKRIIDDTGADTSITASFAASHMVQAAIRSDGDWSIYQDTCRLYPQYAGDWVRKLERQFGRQVLEDARRNHYQLFQIIDGTTRASLIQAPTTLQRKNESIPEFMRRSFATAAEVGLDALSAMLDRRFKDYRALTYSIRDLTPN